MKVMKKIGVNAAFFIAALLLTTTGARAQTAERLETIKAGESKNVGFVIDPKETKKYVISLVQGTNLTIAYENPPKYQSGPPPADVKLTQDTDSATTSYAGVKGTNKSDEKMPEPVPATIEWELSDGTKKINSGSDAKEAARVTGGFMLMWADRNKSTTVPANGNFFITIKCVAQSKCDRWVRIQVDKDAPIPANPNDPEEEE